MCRARPRASAPPAASLMHLATEASPNPRRRRRFPNHRDARKDANSMASMTLDRATGFDPGIARPNLKLKFDLRRIIMASVVAILGLGAGVYGYDWLANGRFIESTDDAYVGGNVTAIAPHVAGFVSQLAVDDNQHVRKGQLLLRLDDRDFRAAVDHAEAVVQAQQAALSDLQAKYVLQQSLIRQSEADLAARQAQGKIAHDDNGRYQDLLCAVGARRRTRHNLPSLRRARPPPLPASILPCCRPRSIRRARTWRRRKPI